MTGSSVFDYIHQQDHQELADQLGLTLSTGQPLPSPSSLGSEEGATGSQGTMNPDGKLPCKYANRNNTALTLVPVVGLRKRETGEVDRCKEGVLACSRHSSYRMSFGNQ